MTVTFGSVWDAIEDTAAAAAHLRARAEVMNALQGEIAAWDLSQVEAARRLGVTQPRLSDLLRGKIDKFSFDALADLADKAGLSIVVTTTRRAA